MLDLVYIMIYRVYKFIMPLIIRLYTTAHSYWEVIHRNSINLKEGKGVYKIIYVYNVYRYHKVIHYISNIHIRTNFEHLQKCHSFLNKNSTCVYLYLAIPISSPHQLIGTFRNELEILGWVCSVLYQKQKMLKVKHQGCQQDAVWISIESQNLKDLICLFCQKPNWIKEIHTIWATGILPIHKRLRPSRRWCVYMWYMYK